MEPNQHEPWPPNPLTVITIMPNIKNVDQTRTQSQHIIKAVDITEVDKNVTKKWIIIDRYANIWELKQIIKK